MVLNCVNVAFWFVLLNNGTCYLMNESFMYTTTTTNDDAINMFRTHFIMKMFKEY